MREADLEQVRIWLGLPHVARSYLAGSTLEQELDGLRQCIAREQPTYALMVLERGRPVGWCQWYVCADYPDHAAGVGAEPGDIGLDFAIGDPARVSKGWARGRSRRWWRTSPKAPLPASSRIRRRPIGLRRAREERIRARARGNDRVRADGCDDGDLPAPSVTRLLRSRRSGVLSATDLVSSIRALASSASVVASSWA